MTGNLAVEVITAADMNRLHLKLSDRPYRANRVLAYVDSAFSWGQRNGLVEKGFNPAADVKRFKEPSRERYLTAYELKRLGEVLRLAENERVPGESRHPARRPSTSLKPIRSKSIRCMSQARSGYLC